MFKAGPERLLLVKHIPEIIRKGAIGAEEPLRHPREDGIVSFIPISAKMKISDKDERIVGVLIGKDENGKLYYDSFIRKEAPSELPEAIIRAPDGAGEPKALLDNNIHPASGDVKGKGASESAETSGDMLRPVVINGD